MNTNKTEKTNRSLSETATPETDGTMAVPDTIAPFHTRRSLRACIADGWRIFALRPGTWLKQLFPAALMAGTGWTLLLWATFRLFTGHILPAMLYIQSGHDAGTVRAHFTPTLSQGAAFAVFVAIGLLLVCFAKGLLWEQIRHFCLTGSLQEKGLLLPGKKNFRLFKAYLAFSSAIAAVFLLPTALIGGLSAWSGTGYPMLIMLPIGLFVSVIAVPGRAAHLAGDKTPVQAFREMQHSGLRHWGGYFLVMLLTAIPLTATIAAFALPFITLLLAGFADTASTETGEVSGLPSYFTALFFATSITAVTLSFLVSALQSWALALKWGAEHQEIPEKMPESNGKA